MNFDYSYLRGFIKQNFKTNEEYAKFLGIGTTALYERLKNNVPFSQDEIYKTIYQSKKERLKDSEIELLFFNI